MCFHICSCALTVFRADEHPPCSRSLLKLDINLHRLLWSSTCILVERWRSCLCLCFFLFRKTGIPAVLMFHQHLNAAYISGSNSMRNVSKSHMHITRSVLIGHCCLYNFSENSFMYVAVPFVCVDWRKHLWTLKHLKTNQSTHL